MAIDKNSPAYTLIDDLVDELVSSEKITQRKANTVTATIGFVITTLITGGTALVESGTSLPDWFPYLVGVLGMIGTILGVSKTPNGMTPSTGDKLKQGLTNRIDLNHLHEMGENAEQTIRNAGSAIGQGDLVDRALNLRDVAETILSNADRR